MGKAALVPLFLAATLGVHAGDEPKPAEPNRVVLICGTGASPHFESITNQTADFLTDQKVKVKAADGHEFARTTCISKTVEAAAGSLLYIAADISEKDRSIVTAQCLTSDGRKLWEEEVKGPWLTTSVNATVRTITQQLLKKLGPHVGHEGLPESPGSH
jgi:hypothetical protein